MNKCTYTFHLTIQKYAYICGCYQELRNWVKAAICFQGKSQGKIEFNLQVKVKYSFWIAGSGQKGHIKVSVLPSGNFLGICSFFFLELSMVLGAL